MLNHAPHQLNEELAIIILLTCLCCGCLCWCGWLKGCTDFCWNVICCGKYKPLQENENPTPNNNNGAGDEDLDTDDNVEMGNIGHVLVPPDEDNMELAALSEHADDRNNHGEAGIRGVVVRRW